MVGVSDGEGGRGGGKLALAGRGSELLYFLFIFFPRDVCFFCFKSPRAGARKMKKKSAPTCGEGGGGVMVARALHYTEERVKS